MAKKIVVMVRRTDGVFDAASTVDDKFARSATGQTLSKVVEKLLGPHLMGDFKDGDEIAVNVAIVPAADVERAELRAAQERETSEAHAEAARLEALAKARAREQAAREVLSGS